MALAAIPGATVASALFAGAIRCAQDALPDDANPARVSTACSIRLDRVLAAGGRMTVVLEAGIAVLAIQHLSPLASSLIADVDNAANAPIIALAALVDPNHDARAGFGHALGNAASTVLRVVAHDYGVRVKLAVPIEGIWTADVAEEKAVA